MATVTDGTQTFTPKVRYTAGSSYASRNIVHDLLGGDVAVTFGGYPRAKGTLDFLFEDEYASYIAYLILRDGHVFQIFDGYDSEMSPMYFVVSGDITRAWDSSSDAWTISVDFTEVQQ